MTLLNYFHNFSEQIGWVTLLNYFHNFSEQVGWVFDDGCRGTKNSGHTDFLEILCSWPLFYLQSTGMHILHIGTAWVLLQ
jgi:hypothetical protein